DPFDRKRIRNFLRREVPDQAEALYQRVCEDEALEEMVSNPFSLQALAFINQARSKAAPRGGPNIPSTRPELTREFTEQLLAREAEDKQSDLLATIPGGLDTLRAFLAELAFRLQQRREGGTSVSIQSLADVVEKYPRARDLLWIARRVRVLGK